MSEQDDLLREISNLFGPFARNLQFDDGTSIPLARPEPLQGPLRGYGDPVSVGDWVIVTHHSNVPLREREEDTMPWQITYISPHAPYTMWFDTSHGGFTCDAGVPGGSFWRTFQKVDVEQVPLYLRESLPLPEGATDSTLHQLSKRQILTKFAEQSEVICYVATVDQKRRLVVLREMMPLLLEWEYAASARPAILKRLRPKFSYVAGDFEGWIASESQIEKEGIVVAKKHQFCLYLYDLDGEGATLASLLERSRTS